MEGKRNALSVILAILLGVSLFCNGWMAHELKAIITRSAPKNCDMDCNWYQWIIDPIGCAVCE